MLIFYYILNVIEIDVARINSHYENLVLVVES